MNILNPVEMIQRVTGTYCCQIDKLLAPLKPLGITYFAWQRVSHAGYWNIFGNHANWLEYSAGQEFYHLDPTLVDPKLYMGGISYCNAYGEPEFLEVMMKSAVELFKIDHCLAVMERTEFGNECAFFAAEAGNTQVLNTYINHVPTLKKFVRYFKQEFADEIQQSTELIVNLTSLKPQTFYQPKMCMDFGDVPSTTFEFNTQPATLSKREKECLMLSLRGKTAKQIGQLLGLSFRTVEGHLAKVKSKLGYQNKREIFALLDNE